MRVLDPQLDAAWEVAQMPGSRSRLQGKIVTLLGPRPIGRAVRPFAKHLARTASNQQMGPASSAGVTRCAA